MSRILVIQPHKMLQHAFSIALFPEHQVQVMETIPDAAALGDAELVIVDAAALKEMGLSLAKEFRSVQNWKIPTIWIDEQSEAQTPPRDKWVRLSRPAEKDSLRKALAECLGSADVGKRPGNSQNKPAASARSTREEQQGPTSGTHPDDKFIELVEVVDESSPHDRSKAAQKKTK
jgi:DNA-binding NtrC family response regulator